MADAATAAAAAGQGSGGLPQFDASQWPGEIVWLLIVFAILVFLFSKVFTPRIGGTIADREDKISGDIGEARRLRDEAEAQSKAAADDLAQARARAHKLAADSKAEAAAEASRRQAEEEAKVGQALADAEARIASARSQAMAQVRQIAAEAAEAIVHRLTGETAAPAEVDQALASLS